MIRSHCSSVISTKGAKPEMAALVTMISIGPRSLRTLPRASTTAARFDTSTAAANASGPTGTQFLRGVLSLLAVHVENCHPMSSGREVTADAKPDARCPAGDHGYPAHGAPSTVVNSR